MSGGIKDDVNIVETEVPREVVKAVKKKQKKDDRKPLVLYMDVEEYTTSIKGKLKKAVIEVVDEWVNAYKMPIRRKKLIELVCAREEIAEKCNENRMSLMRTLEYVINEMFKEGDLVKVLDRTKKTATYYILPKHVELFKNRLKEE